MQKPQLTLLTSNEVASFPKKRSERKALPKRENGQGSIYLTKSNNKKYKATVYDITGKRRYASFKTKKEAERWLSEMIRAREGGLNPYSQNPKITVLEFLNEWLKNHAPNIKRNTIRNYQGTIDNRIAPHIGKYLSSKLTATHINEMLDALRRADKKAGTVLGALRVLRMAYGQAFREGKIPFNPVAQVKTPKMTSTPTKPIPAAHFKKIYRKAAEDPFMHLRVEIGAFISLRPGEIFGLLWSDLDLEAKTLTVERQVQRYEGLGLVFDDPKVAGSHIIPLTDDQIAIFLKHKVAQEKLISNWPEYENLIFTNTVGKKMDPKRDSALWRKLLEDAWVPYYSLYRMRKTGLTNLNSRVKDMRTVMEYSGHKQMSTLTKSYVFPTSEALIEGLKGMDELRKQLTEGE